MTAEASGAEARLDSALMENAKSTSPLNELLPNISMKKLKPLVTSFCDKVATLDLSLRDSRVTLAHMFLEIIQAVSKLILDGFKDIVIEGRKEQGPLLLSEEAVTRAVHPSLCESFKTALGSTHKSMNKLFKLVCEEVTSLVNHSLCCSKVKGDRLVIVEDNNYKPSKDKMKVIGAKAKTVLRACFLTCCAQTMDSPESIEEHRHKHHEDKQDKVKEVDEPTEEYLIPHVSANKRTTKPDSPSLKAATVAVKDILEQEAARISEEDLSFDSEDSASSIVIFLDEMKQMHPEGSRASPINAPQKDISARKTSCLKGVTHKIKSYFVWCYARATLCRLLCFKACTVRSREKVIERASPLLKDLASGGTSEVMDGDIYDRLAENIGLGYYDSLTEDLTDIISENLSTKKVRRREVRAELKVFLENIRRWIHLQQQIPVTIDPVQTALKKICNLSFWPALNASQIQALDDVQQQSIDYVGLMYEVSKRIFKKSQWSETYELCKSMQQHLKLQNPELDFKPLAQPNIEYTENLADAIYSELCRDRKKSWVRNSAIYHKEYITVIMDTMHNHLESPPPSRRTVGSVLRSVFCFCRGR